VSLRKVAFSLSHHLETLEVATPFTILLSFVGVTQCTDYPSLHAPGTCVGSFGCYHVQFSHLLLMIT
jgi:hypothetical protein